MARLPGRPSNPQLDGAVAVHDGREVVIDIDAVPRHAGHVPRLHLSG